MERQKPKGKKKKKKIMYAHAEESFYEPYGGCPIHHILGKGVLEAPVCLALLFAASFLLFRSTLFTLPGTEGHVSILLFLFFFFLFPFSSSLSSFSALGFQASVFPFHVPGQWSRHSVMGNTPPFFLPFVLSWRIGSMFRVLAEFTASTSSEKARGTEKAASFLHHAKIIVDGTGRSAMPWT
ncbi:hypothetical protein SODALDRAFT_198666 [Sodiomyces alkalinus F11]|uniref:Uncharacterized protein n=1 Tax=Sodiomyces alkalinus (strain CBS 110278 / VKM F-3762 / F11) TaxID=1314773 RepID=A0A3N2PSK6_SODAK|nr:hypothetical protein SODALDRAFT_198666 [Sodiomyces alkalinus F11]ROT37501.1 hypothetical protein SODALDRAFT_198666 [Sodiomyces alkalinus F11]